MKTALNDAGELGPVGFCDRCNELFYIPYADHELKCPRKVASLEPVPTPSECMISDFRACQDAGFATLQAKNHDYAAGGDPFGNFQRVAQILVLYPKLNLGTPEVVALVYMLKQLDCVLWGLSSGHELKVEGLDGRLTDVEIYATLLRLILQRRAQALAKEPPRDQAPASSQPVEWPKAI